MNYQLIKQHIYALQTASFESLEVHLPYVQQLFVQPLCVFVFRSVIIGDSNYFTALCN